MAYLQDAHKFGELIRQSFADMRAIFEKKWWRAALVSSLTLLLILLHPACSIAVCAVKKKW